MKKTNNNWEFSFLVKVGHVNPQSAHSRISQLREILWNAALDTNGFHNGDQQVTQVRQGNTAETGVWEGPLQSGITIAGEKRVLRRYEAKELKPITKSVKKRQPKQPKRKITLRRHN